MVFFRYVFYNSVVQWKNQIDGKKREEDEEEEEAQDAPQLTNEE